MTFDLEKARDLATNPIHCPETDEIFVDAIAEIERLRTENRELLHEIKDLSRIIDTGYKQLVCDRTGLNERQDLPEGIRRMAASVQELKGDLETAKSSLKYDRDEIKRLRGEMENYGNDYVCQMKSKDARIKELEADLEQSERVIEARLEVIDQQAARIQELEDALAEERAWRNFYMANARTEAYADYGYSLVKDHRFSEARQQLIEEGKIGPDAAPRSWQITDERIATISASLKVLERLKKVNTDTDHCYLDAGIAVLRAMLDEAGQ